MIKRVPFLWLITFAIAFAQEIPVIQTYVLVPEIEDSYTIVNSYLYPTEIKSNKFVAATAPDYYVTKLMKDRKDSPLQGQKSGDKGKKSSRDIYIEIEQQKDIPFIPVNNKIPEIIEYLATKEIYPSATNHPAQTASNTATNNNQNPSVPVPPEKKPRIQNFNKKIEWKANDILPLTNFIVEEGVEVQLKKSELISQTGLGQIASQGQVKKDNVETQKQITPISEVQKTIISESPFIPSEFIHKPSQSTPREPQPKHPEHPLQYQELQRKKFERDQIYLDILFVFIFILIIILITCFIVRYQRKKKSSIWSTVNKKLDKYRYVMPVREQEEEDQLGTMKDTISEEQQD